MTTGTTDDHRHLRRRQRLDDADRHPRGVASIAVTPANPSIAKGLTQQFTATGTYTDSSTQNLTSSGRPGPRRTPSVATIDAAGLATALATGTRPSRATLERRDRHDHADRHRRDAGLDRGHAGRPERRQGPDRAIHARPAPTPTARRQNLTTSVIWASANTSVATISGAGLASALATGSSTITATLGTA